MLVEYFSWYTLEKSVSHFLQGPRYTCLNCSISIPPNPSLALYVGGVHWAGGDPGAVDWEGREVGRGCIVDAEGGGVPRGVCGDLVGEIVVDGKIEIGSLMGDSQDEAENSDSDALK